MFIYRITIEEESMIADILLLFAFRIIPSNMSAVYDKQSPKCADLTISYNQIL